MPLLVDLDNYAAVLAIHHLIKTPLSKTGFWRLVDIVDANAIGDYFILSVFPEKQHQIGETCGIVATAIAMKHAAGKEGVFLPAYKQGKKEKSVREVAKGEKGEAEVTDFGRVYRTASLEILGKQLGYSSVRVVPMNDPSEEYYVNTLCKELSAYRTVIAAVDINAGTGQPGNFNGDYCHWALLFGYLVINKECYFLVTHHGAYHLWSAHDLFLSNKQLPMKSSYLHGSSYYKYFVGTQKMRGILEQTNRPSNVLKEIPFEEEQSLEHFRFGLCSWHINTNLIAPKPVANYARSKENLKLAEICADYSVEETLFDEYLSLKGPYPDEALPNIAIDGSKIGHPGYYFLKFPKNDPNVHVLREMVNSDSEKVFLNPSITHALTADNSGFYVLVKAKKTDIQDMHLMDEQSQPINLDDYIVVGITEAWVTTFGNVALFSENAWTNRDQPVIVAFTKKFADKLFADKQSAGKFLRVLSCGRCANKITNAFASTESNESIKVGSERLRPIYQALVGINEEKVKAIGFDSIKQKEWFDSLFQNEEHNYKPVFNDSYDELCKTARTSAFLLEVCFLLHLANKLKPQLVDLIRSLDLSQRKEINFLDILSYLVLEDPSFLETPWFEQAIVNQAKLSGIKGLYQLFKLEPELVTEEHLHDLTSGFSGTAASHISEFSRHFLQLATLDSGLIKGKNLTLFKEASLANMIFFAQIIGLLFAVDPNLVNEENRQLLLTLSEPEARELQSLLSSIIKANPSLINQTSFWLLVSMAHSTRFTANVLEKLDTKAMELELFHRFVICIDKNNWQFFRDMFEYNSDYKTPEACTYLLDKYEEASRYYSDHLVLKSRVGEFLTIYLTKHGLKQDEPEIIFITYLHVCRLLFENGLGAKRYFVLFADPAAPKWLFYQHFLDLIKTNSLLVSEKLELLIEIRENYSSFLEKYPTLFNHLITTGGLDLFTEDNSLFLIGNSQHAPKLVDALINLFNAEPALISGETRNQLLAQDGGSNACMVAKELINKSSLKKAYSQQELPSMFNANAKDDKKPDSGPVDAMPHSGVNFKHSDS